MKINLFPLHWGLPMGNCEHFANLGGLEVHLLLLLRTEPPAEKGTPPTPTPPGGMAARAASVRTLPIPLETVFLPGLPEWLLSPTQ